MDHPNNHSSTCKKIYWKNKKISNTRVATGLEPSQEIRRPFFPTRFQIKNFSFYFFATIFFTNTFFCPFSDEKMFSLIFPLQCFRLKKKFYPNFPIRYSFLRCSFSPIFRNFDSVFSLQFSSLTPFFYPAFSEVKIFLPFFLIPIYLSRLLRLPGLSV